MSINAITYKVTSINIENKYPILGIFDIVKRMHVLINIFASTSILVLDFNKTLINFNNEKNGSNSTEVKIKFLSIIIR